MRTGYYVFLGGGDYHLPPEINKQWMMTWDLIDWKNFIDELLSLDINTLMIYLNGHKLPYLSGTFSELVDYTHPNVIKEFLPEALSYAKDRGLMIIAVITTTGHAGGYAQLNPEAKITPQQTAENTEDLLLSFPKHMRQGKLAKKEGAAQLGFGVLCHNKTLGRTYAKNVLTELIQLYGKYFDGIALHPPETTYPCCCHDCKQYCLANTGLELEALDIYQARKIFVTSYLKFQQDILIPIIHEKLPDNKVMTFTIPWLFERSLTEIFGYFSRYTHIIEWDYNLSPSRLSSLPERLHNYKMLGPDIWFMPTAGFSFDPSSPTSTQISALEDQLRLVNDALIDGVVHFLGPRLSAYLVETSYKTLISDKYSSLQLHSF